MGFGSGEYGDKKISLHSIVQVMFKWVISVIFFNKYTDFFSMMYTAVVQDKDTLKPGIWIGERYL